MEAIGMKKIPLGIQTLREIIQEGYVYVDKTVYIYNLLNDAKYYFLSRPRRFGKSLLLDTIAEVFNGNGELFKGLYIHDSGYAFPRHPVLRLDMSSIANKSPDALEESLSTALRMRAAEEGIAVTGSFPSDIFQYLIMSMHKKYGQRVVVLIDEYDKPILDHLDDIDTAEANRKVIRGFYGILKAMDPHLRMTFITGVSKFTKTSVFSELNNLTDITMMPEYSNICGVTTDDLTKYFAEHIENLQQLDSLKHYGNIQDGILEWYDGYSWDGITRVINPYSLLSFLIHKRFSAFWYASGTPNFLINLIREKPTGFLELRDLEVTERTLDSFDIRKMSIVPLLFQTGYLTVEEKSRRGNTESYLLKIPNLEVHDAFYLNLVTDLTENDDSFTESSYWRIKDALQAGDLNSVLAVLKRLFASIPYQLHVKNEAYYHSIFYAFLSLLGFDTSVEVSVAGGRIDAVLELVNTVYIMELKYEDGSTLLSGGGAAEDKKRKLFDKALYEGMKQIESKGYANKYTGSGKVIYKAVFAFLGRDEIEMRVEVL